MRNRIFGWIMTVGFVAGGGEVAAQEPLRQGPQEEGVVLRFDEARRDTLADVPSATAETLPAAAGRPFAYKLNRRRVTREEAYGRLHCGTSAACGSRTVVCDLPIRHGANGCDC